MTDYARERYLAKKREYYRKWRAEHPESVKRSQAKYWSKQVEEKRQDQIVQDHEVYQQ